MVYDTIYDMSCDMIHDTRHDLFSGVTSDMLCDKIIFWFTVYDVFYAIFTALFARVFMTLRPLPRTRSPRKVKPLPVTARLKVSCVEIWARPRRLTGAAELVEPFDGAAFTVVVPARPSSLPGSLLYNDCFGHNGSAFMRSSPFPLLFFFSPSPSSA